MKKITRYSFGLLSGILSLFLITGCASGGKAVSATMPAGEAAADVAQAPGEIYYEAEADGAMANHYQPVYGGDSLNSEEYHGITEQGYKSVAEQPLSTFSIDVDTASYGNIRRMINRGQEVPKDAVRIEEMLNYFSYDYDKPTGDMPFSVNTELSDCPWNPENQLLLVGLQAKEIDFENRPMANLVFLLDVSGSMYDEDKLPLVQKSFSMLAEELTENDRVSIVTYAGYEKVILKGARGDQKEKIRNALEGLAAGGSTAGEAGINMAYDLAADNFIEGGNNRIILATDGDLNVGVSSEEGLISLIEEKRKSGIHLSVLGFGTGNLKDNKMEALADHGDGNYNYIDSQKEAKKVLVEEMGGTLITVAKDVKLQLEFNPAQAQGYRLIGYENRALKDEDFADDTVDAGEIGAGHRVTALYELIRPGKGGIELKYQETQPENREKKATDDELLTISLRYKEPDGEESRLMTSVVKADAYQKNMSHNLKFASAVAEFGMLLRDSEFKGDSSYKGILDLLSEIPERYMDDYKDEFRKLVLMVMAQ